MLLSGKSAKNGGGLLGGESDEDDVEHLDYVRLCSGGGTSSTVIYRVFYIIFLIFETRFFFHFEIKHKSNRYKYK